MRSNWRIIAIVAGAAFVLSAFVGLIGGVRFGVLLFRALLIGALFAGGTIGVGILVDRFLPELRETVEGETAPESGRSVDIVVDEDPLASDELPEQLPEEEDRESGSDNDEPAPEPAEENDESASDTDEDDGTDDRESAAGSFSPGLAATEVDVSGSDSEEIEELPEDTEADSLPDMDRMSESFVEPAESESSVAQEESGSSGGDPSIMAKAIRTVLKREEA